MRKLGKVRPVATGRAPVVGWEGGWLPDCRCLVSGSCLSVWEDGEDGEDGDVH